MGNTYTVIWTGKWPCLCSGKWVIRINGQEAIVPKLHDQHKAPFDTYKIYKRWYFEKKWNEVWEEYKDGLNLPEWKERKKDWLDLFFSLNRINPTEEDYKDLYAAINEQDWRRGSCGGCI